MKVCQSEILTKFLTDYSNEMNSIFEWRILATFGGRHQKCFIYLFRFF